jgi:hypothetical protein
MAMDRLQKESLAVGQRPIQTDTSELLIDPAIFSDPEPRSSANGASQGRDWNAVAPGNPSWQSPPPQSPVQGSVPAQDSTSPQGESSPEEETAPGTPNPDAGPGYNPLLD